MDQNHGAAGGPADDDVFGPIEDGEEVFEWIDDQDHAEPAEGQPARQPAPTFRERLAAARSGGRRLRRSRRQIAAVTAVLVLACAIGGACTAWFDGVAGAADRADQVWLAIDSVVDGDPAASSYNAAERSAVGQFVVEVANNSPDAVTLDSVKVDAGTLMTSTGWRPLGPSARIPGGGTGKVALTVRLFCPMVVLSQQNGMFAAAPGTGGGATLSSFPAVHIRARDSDGDAHDLVLPTRVTASAQLANGQQSFRSPGGGNVPEIVSADAGACSQYAEDRATQRSAGATAGRFSNEVEFSYDKVLSPAADKALTFGFTVKNTGARTETLTARPDPGFAEDNRLSTTWLPSVIKLAPGQTTSARLTVHIRDCTSILSGAPVLGLTMLELDDSSGDFPQPVFIDQVLHGSLRLAGDIVQQDRAACA